ncbi:hypothetical protein BC833DRAFT_604469 [Globomyces pollinis-pini]|nr:hypothetical protein BC833DRAFT_604469 [Globomyces pollinis-pini]
MMKRNTILQYRYLTSTLAQVLFAPFIFSLLIFVLQKADHANQSIANPHPPVGALGGVPKCQGGTKSANCVTILYTPATIVNGVDYTKIMQTFAKKNAERTGYEFQIENPLTDAVANLSTKLDIAAVPNADFIYDFAVLHPNTTSWGITFNQPADSSVLNIQYQLWFNATNVANSTDIFGRPLLSMIRGIDEAIISTLNNPDVKITTEYDIDVQLKDWPLIPASKLADSIVQQLGAVFFFCSEMIIFINVLNTIVSEKELKLRHGMEVMGLKPSVYWLSHLLSNSLLVFVNAVFSSIWGLIFGFEAFKNTNFVILVITFFLFGESMVMMAFFITTFVRRTRVAILIGIFIFIIGLLFESFVFASAYLGYIWWSTSLISPLAWQIQCVFVPFFNFGRFFLDITTLTTGTLDTLTQQYIPGPGFPWETLFSTLPNSSLPNYGADAGYPTVPAPVTSWHFMIQNFFLYAVLMWYFDNVIPNEYGYRQAPWFFLLPSYWGFASRSATVDLSAWHAEHTKIEYAVEENEDCDVTAERKISCDPAFMPSLKILNLRKVYTNWGREQDKIAVRNSCFTVKEGKLLALLGQNGAGKSTTISMLSGLTPSSSGDAIIYNMSVKNSMQQIRKIMGICPQHDILFDDLTAREHIQLYAGLKGVPQEQWEPLIQERLQFVRLLTVADVRAGTYSGGMKRRLSLVIATIGDPKIIFLDEPTTGMDPVNRRHVWSFIEKFKRDRVIVLTTHSMEEADVLGDRVCVMSKGRLRAINNSIALKNKFGAGYRVSVVTDQKEADKVKKLITDLIPNAKLEDDAAGALIYQFPAASMGVIPTVVDWLENNKDGLVKSWGLSQSTLEEVFLILIREANTLFK